MDDRKSNQKFAQSHAYILSCNQQWRKSIFTLVKYDKITFQIKCSSFNTLEPAIGIVSAVQIHIWLVWFEYVCHHYPQLCRSNNSDTLEKMELFHIENIDMTEKTHHGFGNQNMSILYIDQDFVCLFLHLNFFFIQTNRNDGSIWISSTIQVHHCYMSKKKNC